MDLSKKGWQWFTLAMLATIWGSSFILMKRGLESFSSQQVAAFRMFIAFAALSPFIAKHIKKEFLPRWKYFLICGLFGNFIPAFLFTKAETTISSSLAGMLNSLTPLFTLLLGITFFKLRTGLLNVLGVVLGFSGALGLLMGQYNDNTTNLQYGGLVVLATLCYAISVNTVKRYLSDINPLTITTWSFTFIGPVAGLYLFSTDLTSSFSSPKALPSFIYTILLALFGTAISTIWFYKLVKHTSALLASSVTYLIPIVAMFWGIADGEKITFGDILWILVILVGIWLVNKKKTS